MIFGLNFSDFFKILSIAFFTGQFFEPRGFAMFIGRFFGWLLLLTAIVTASAEAVAALGTGEYIGIATADVVTIITGISPQTPLLRCPAWVSLAVVGIALMFMCRKKTYRSSFGSK